MKVNTKNTQNVNPRTQLFLIEIIVQFFLLKKVFLVKNHVFFVNF